MPKRKAKSNIQDVSGIVVIMGGNITTHRTTSGLSDCCRSCAEEGTGGPGLFIPSLPQQFTLGTDLLDVVVAALANPLAGLGVAVKKIAEKAREDVKN